ncbi:ABC transporter permease [Corynebacterium sp. CCM 9185]|uniref:ABC transporter permease n=1 Tax=Corynebacterium marambiense TaxID=2765364 RepID=A0ABS0VU29_9CORY|nr:hypothetical protein [Corynebacterium marambiense]MBI9000278.1 hypothetical protein [Corynebacterium marambiense]MCK7663632.1 ABC transporter permease [Corynebacterium marambiense]
MTTTFLNRLLRYTLTDISIMLAAVFLPVAVYLGVTFDTGQWNTPAGPVANLHFIVAMSIALYGTATVAANEGATITAERDTNWLRAIALTRLGMNRYIAVKLLITLVVSVVPILAIAAISPLRGAEAPVSMWFAVGTCCLVGAVIFGLFGLMMGLWFSGSTVTRYMGLIMMLIAFMGNLFLPLEGMLLDLARFTPMFGPGMLTRSVIWYLSPGTGGGADNQLFPLWQLILNMGAWTLIFVALAWLGHRRGLRR